MTCLYDVLKAKTGDSTKLAALSDFDYVLGLNLLPAAEKARAEEPKQETAGEQDPAIDALLAQRAQAKKEKNWTEADRIRDELKAQGIEIIDTPQGATWRRA